MKPRVLPTLLACAAMAATTLSAAAAPAYASTTLKPGADVLKALGSAKKGTTITLASGSWSALWLDKWTTKKLDLTGVTLRGASRTGVVVHGLTLKGVKGLTVTNLTLANSSSAPESVVRISDGSSHLVFDHVTVKPKAHSGFDIWKKTSYVTVRASIVDGRGVTGKLATNGTARAISVNGAPYDLGSWPSNLTFSGNDLFGAGSDIITIAGGKHVVISGNRIHDPQKNADHNDGIQSVGSDDLKIVGNRFWAPGPNGPDQAIMLGPNRSVSTLRVSGTYIADNLVTAWRGSGINLVSTKATRVINNTVGAMGTSGSRGSSLVKSGNSGLQVVNNILFKVYGSGAVARQDHNCIADGATSKDIKTSSPGYDTGNDFKLLASSRCRNNADSSAATKTDVGNRSRDAKPDRGAWEYVGK
ncbi:parallel beta helix pectate lyase-like protein [Motilibacter peucedani]|uniref:Parallel beta helix pectate lyase-like protein n=1 Tax=Motilibacter peucedani TaxID=598650 RepID=A0A420XKB1_9ACTN|nr:right-handed parallel beta-helix repeat-containing protein [Motilibacter peucedani]RKS68519.1 parallel beta helix pectate lyase-like protein [Motilibacter peucedani]